MESTNLLCLAAFAMITLVSSQICVEPKGEMNCLRNPNILAKDESVGCDADSCCVKAKWSKNPQEFSLLSKLWTWYGTCSSGQEGEPCDLLQCKKCAPGLKCTLNLFNKEKNWKFTCEGRRTRPFFTRRPVTSTTTISTSTPSTVGTSPSTVTTSTVGTSPSTVTTSTVGTSPSTVTTSTSESPETIIPSTVLTTIVTEEPVVVGDAAAQ